MNSVGITDRSGPQPLLSLPKTRFLANFRVADQSGSYRDPDRFWSHALLSEPQSSIRKRFAIARMRCHIHSLRPAVGHTVIDLAIAGHRHELPAASPDGTGLSAGLRIVARLRVHRQPFLLHRSYGPLLGHIVGGMDEIRLQRCTDVRAKKILTQ